MPSAPGRARSASRSRAEGSGSASKPTVPSRRVICTGPLSMPEPASCSPSRTSRALSSANAGPAHHHHPQAGVELAHQPFAGSAAATATQSSVNSVTMPA